MTAIRDARIRLPDEMIRALDLRCGDVSRSTYVRRLVEQDERTDGAVYAAAVQGLRPGARSGGGVPVAPPEPGLGAAVSPPPAAVAEPVPVTEPSAVEDEPEDVEPEPVSPPRRSRPRTSEEWGS